MKLKIVVEMLIKWLNHRGKGGGCKKVCCWVEEEWPGPIGSGLFGN